MATANLPILPRIESIVAIPIPAGKKSSAVRSRLALTHFGRYPSPHVLSAHGKFADGRRGRGRRNLELTVSHVSGGSTLTAMARVGLFGSMVSGRSDASITGGFWFEKKEKTDV